MNKWARPIEGSRASAAPAGRQVTRVEHHYFAFLSYSHLDSEYADWLHRELERFRVPSSLVGRLTSTGVVPRRLTPIFRDRHELAAAVDLGAEIREALSASHCLIVLCSPAAARSKWTNAEIEEFKRIHPEGPIIAAIVAGEPFASPGPEECFPPALRRKYDRRGRATAKIAEPLAADLRESGDGKRLGFLKIVAGMLGLSLDDLVQRDQLRRQRRLAGISGASVVGMLIAGGLAVTAIQARDEARDQRREAEGLVEFMLGDLKDKLEPIGRLDALDGVGSRVLEYYSKQDMSDLSDSGLIQRSRALGLTAQVAYRRGNLDSAARLYREATAGTAEAVRRAPGDTQRLFDHSQNVFWIGELARFGGRLGDAEAAYRDYKRHADRLAALEPDNLRWRMEALYGDQNIGIVLYYQRRFAEAARQFAGALSPMMALASVDPGNTEYQKEVSSVLAWLADTERSQGQLERATQIRSRQIELLQRLVSENSAHVAYRRELIPAHQALGMLLSAQGRTESGIEQLRKAVAEANRLIPIEPENIVWKAYAAQARLELARTFLALGRTAEAAGEARAGCALAADVQARDAGASWRRLQTNCLAMRSRLALKSGATGAALALAGQAVAAARAERATDPVSTSYSIAAAHRLLGDIHQRAGNGEAAKAAWGEGLAQLPSGVAERPAEINERAELLKRLGRESEAGPLVRKLADIGYRNVS
ncbi:MAG TPA: toll/interleukin-1 receptor domain-containing protein [Sphingomicrobium sp.]|nr:toll/interleukin-1 receptor domain-containing protein [Sphingomicrobium sp.]